MNNLNKLWEEVVISDNQKALKKIYELYFEKLFVFALRILKSKELSEETISDIFIKIWQNRKSLSDIRNLETYLYVLVRNHSLNRINKELKHVKNHISISDEHASLVIENYTPENQFFAEELRDQIDIIVNQLPPACKNAFLLVKEDKLKYQEAAKVLEVSPFTVKNHVQKAVNKIRKFLIEKANTKVKVRKISNM